MIALEHRGLCRCPVPMTLYKADEDDNESDGLDNDQFLKQLSGNFMHQWLSVKHLSVLMNLL